MSNERSTDPISVPSSSAHRRRASLASGLSFADYLSRSGSQGHSAGAPTGSMDSSVGNAPPSQGRRLSITTLGLAGSPNQSSPWGSKSMRHGSISSSVGSGSANLEDAVVEDSESGGPSSAAPHSPFARRLSFGAQALRDARAGSISNGEGFNWSEALRTRAERAPSLGITSPNTPQTQLLSGSGQQCHHQRATSIASMEQPTREIPKQPKQNKPDFFQEKILRGDFMD
ncbi:uncharacterized protein BO95DRAFT_288640 [Aspergillus brunneoviolaceus CBS 621.78]|uniref:Uncharacterized protein n=1 Tax=Aspergillus brunneoviolaceus CBS 621.78 TaxID=1450534 RepID=A0ACD1FUY0_9EURO|nr:hypothetical protein BO95DRAFT_288640 [Aspergillus brunneoviolaceus CBS 621.78]RAH40795.1 hypothetical protein BO95DRAFT_288640 [Aspergillus brunneoviolaceus CBS 621.78]